MTLSESEILRILDLFDRSDWEEIHLESGDIKLAVSKTGATSGFTTPQATRIAAQHRDEHAVLPDAPAIDPTPTSPQPVTEAVADDWVAVRAPLLGTFYAAPKPGAPAFVKVGQVVNADDTVCILEVMKLMNHVKAGVDGVVVRIDCSNGELAEYEHVLMYIKPH